MGRNRNFIEEEVLDKAIVLFQKQGYAATSPEVLVKELGLSRSSLYSTFGDKRGLLIRSLERYRELTGIFLKKIIEENVDPVIGIEKIFEVAIVGCYHQEVPNGCFQVNSIVEFGPGDNGPLEIMQQSFNDCRNTLLHFLKALKENTPAHKNLSLEVTADYLLNTISGMVISAKAGMEENACRRMVKQTLSFLR